jgi:hypothetical protein
VQASADPQVTPAAAHANSTDPNAPVALTPEQVPLKDAQLVFEGDELKCQFTAQVYGKDMVVTLSGRVGARRIRDFHSDQLQDWQHADAHLSSPGAAR